MASWTGESISRTTKDMDMGISPSLIASIEAQGQIQELLTHQGFVPDPDPNNRRWAWDGGVDIELEFHVPPPPPSLKDQLATDRMRVKNLSLRGRNYGIHGRTNPELLGFKHHFSFEYDGLLLTVPNVLTAVMMKLAAFKQRLLSYQKEPVARKGNYSQAEKHARDVFRAVAMETEEDLRMFPGILWEVSESPLYRDCQGIIRDYFSSPGQEGFDFVSGFWTPENRDSILQELKDQFKA
ncbi:hypothetical protein [Akkermansia muciniphila]|uniref:hypothetical protein n=1 Tax=Akkermansia muciniphila TaxID=239935 RepID=UPI000FE40B24|nr:hypothetical protein [Akkermansia muciniphila]KAA3321014.1 hypothetical protein F1937_06715 [Akkermansia muciniphila]KAA3321783.1 hypothetical protein F1963_07185 [Akkermansia muciniphila]KAA3322814.1 hypothetical protein F1931_06725 [Akkermansia muciniphila]KAA3326675.1 hypothetical protein F1932_07205 [Akkermansia muciniphila]KAA3329580.1 hypothetical protein F1935_06730 [Akkermansia muciniphila]